MSRKIILSLAAAATVAAATLASSQSDARGFGAGGAHFAGRGRVTFAAVHKPGRHIPIVIPRPGHPIIGLHHHHHHWVFRGGRWIVGDEEVVVAAPAITPAPGPSPCTCLTKTYTPTGLVVFADVCTKESASSPVNNTADATQAPTQSVAATQIPISKVPTAPNYAGRTYEDYLAANPQATQAANPQPEQGALKN